MIRWLYAAVLASNVASGLQTLVVSTLVYRLTGNALALGAIVSSEFIVSALLQVYAGPLADRYNPRAIMVTGDFLRGLVALLAALLTMWTGSIAPVIASLLISQVVKPFYRTANFALTPEIVSGDELVRANSTLSAFMQAGQLLGVAAAGVLLTWVGPQWAYFALGLLLCISATSLLGIHLPRSVRPVVKKMGVINDWAEVFSLLRKFPSASWHIILASGDLLLIALINVMLVPLNAALGGNNYHLALIDGAFAVGAISMAPINPRLIKIRGPRVTVALGLAGQVLALAILLLARSPYHAAACMLVIGVANSLSVATFMSTLQQRAAGNIKGRVGSLRYFSNSLILTPSVLVFSHVLANTSWQSFVLAALLTMLLYLAAFMTLSQPRLFGTGLLQRSLSSTT